MRGEHLESGAILTACEEARAAAEYNELLLTRPDLARRSHEALLRAHHGHGLMIGGRPLCSVLRPRFITASRLDELSRISAILARVLERAGHLLLRSDHLLDLVGASEMERLIWEIDPGYDGFTVTSRLDAFMPGSAARFVEYNAESPAGIGYCDRLAQLFTELPAMAPWTGGLRSGEPEGQRQLLDTLLWAYREWGGTGVPTIAVIDWDDVLTRRDFELCAEHFRANGHSVVITDPRRLEYRSGRLCDGNTTVDLVYRRVLLHELLDRTAEVRPLLDAYRDGVVCMVNSPRSKLLHKKSVFALLSENRIGLDLDDEEQKVLDDTVPWTRFLTSGETEYGGERVDLERLLVGRQDGFAIKPVDDYGGRGVVLGWDTSPDHWQQALDRALVGGYIVQERVPVPTSEYPVWQDGRLQIVSMLLDTDPLLFRGRLGSILTRLSSSALLNVTAGTGSTTPTFTLEER